MYGSEASQTGALAATGVGLTVFYWTLGIGITALALIALGTVFLVLRHRMKKGED